MIGIASYSLPIIGTIILVGGVFGFVKAKSKASLISGLISGLLFDIAFVLTFTYPQIGLSLGAVVSAFLLVTFAIRLKKTGKFMPAGLLLFLCSAELAITLIALSAH